MSLLTQLKPDWFSSRSEHRSFLRDEISQMMKEVPECIRQMEQEMSKTEDIIDKLENTFTQEQMDLWLELKYHSHQASFHNQRKETKERMIQDHRQELNHD